MLDVASNNLGEVKRSLKMINWLIKSKFYGEMALP